MASQRKKTKKPAAKITQVITLSLTSLEVLMIVLPEATEARRRLADGFALRAYLEAKHRLELALKAGRNRLAKLVATEVRPPDAVVDSPGQPPDFSETEPMSDRDTGFGLGKVDEE